MTRHTVRQRTRDERGVTLIELLVVVSLLSVVLGAIWTVVWSSMRTERFTTEMRVVMDDGRVSLARVRKELRAARQALGGSDESNLHFWVDQNQDNVLDGDENIWYCVRPVGGSTCVDPSSPPADERFELVRFLDADGWPTPTSAQVIARTLLDHETFLYCALPNCGPSTTVDPTDARVVAVNFELDLKDDVRGPDAIDVAATIRLRNVD